MHTKKFQTGFNVMELMVVLFVAGILLSVGVPSFNGFVANGRMSTAANELASTLHTARTEAVKRRVNITVCPSSEWDVAAPTCTDTPFEDGWIIFVDSVPPAAPNMAPVNAAGVLYARGPLGRSITVAAADTNDAIGGNPFVSFGPNGYPLLVMGGNPAVFNFQLCDERGDANTGGGIAAGRWLQLTPTGRPQIYREQAQVQAVANPNEGC